MQLMIKPASVTDRLSVGVSPPESGRVGPTVGAARSLSLGGGLNREQRGEHQYGLQLLSFSTYQATFGFDKGTVCSVHFIVKTTGITEIMAISISPPQWSGSGPAVDTLSALWKEKY